MKTKIISAGLAIAALTSSQAALAQGACVEAADLGDTVIYAMPMLYEAVEAPCSSDFAQSPFMVSEAAPFVERFRDQADASWPGTVRLLKVFMASRDSDDSMAQALAQMPDEALRPLVDVILGQMVKDRIVKDLKPGTCSDIAEIMELLAPLPPENIGGLAGFIARNAKLDNPSICPVNP